MHTTSASLLDRLRQPGEEDAWTRFVQLYSPLLYTWAHRLGLPDADAAATVHREAHGLVADEIYPVAEGA